MGYKLPDFFPASDYHVQVTRPEVWKALSDLDRTFLGHPDDYMGFTSFWDSIDPFKQHLRETSAWARKRIHDVLVHNKVPLLSADRNETQVKLAEEIYRYSL